MKKNLETIETVKSSLEKFKGEQVKMIVNRGRKKLVKFNAVLVDTYPSIFTVSISGETETKQSYSYTEILCGSVKISPKVV